MLNNIKIKNRGLALNANNNRNIEVTVLLHETTTSFFERDFPKEKSNLSISRVSAYPSIISTLFAAIIICKVST